jgi:(5-formylfuran-3-yl)methyl phosphate synthase
LNPISGDKGASLDTMSPLDDISESTDANAPPPFADESGVVQPHLTQFLVSIRDANEAAIAQSAGVDWIDLKEPKSGALGRADVAVAQAVASVLVEHPQRSAALGELSELTDDTVAAFAPHFPFLKVGLSNLVKGNAFETPLNAPWTERFLALVHQLRHQGSDLVPVIYADYEYCRAPAPADVLAIAAQYRPQYLLVDTFRKDGRRLLDWLDLNALQRISDAALQFDCRLVLAGSLNPQDIPTLLTLKPQALAVRGAVCSGERTGTICPAKIRQWCELLHGIGNVSLPGHPPSTFGHTFR